MTKRPGYEFYPTGREHLQAMAPITVVATSTAMRGDRMNFTYNPHSFSGTSTDGRYVIHERDDRYGIFLDIRLDDDAIRTVWVRENNRDLLASEQTIAGDASAAVEWVVDNRLGNGADRPLNLTDAIGQSTLGELLQAYFEAREISQFRIFLQLGKPWPRRIVRVGCRSNQRGLMENRYGP